MDRPEYWLFRPAPLKGFGPVYRTVTLVNTSTVTIILCYCIILLIFLIYCRPRIAVPNNKVFPIYITVQTLGILVLGIWYFGLKQLVQNLLYNTKLVYRAKNK
jgi:hypothetical protein